MKRSFLLAVACVAVMFTVGQVQAAPIFFSSRAAFDTATGGGLNFEGFEGSWTDTSGVAALTGFSVSETGGANNLFHGTEAGGGGFSTTEGVDSLWFDDNGSSVGSFFSFSGPLTAFGLDVSIFNFTPGGSATVTIGGSVSDSIVLSDVTPQFWGVIDSGGLSTITFDRSGSDGIGFDAVSYGELESNPVPEPTSLAIFGIGALCMGAGAARRRRKEKQAAA